MIPSPYQNMQKPEEEIPLMLQENKLPIAQPVVEQPVIEEASIAQPQIVQPINQGRDFGAGLAFQAADLQAQGEQNILNAQADQAKAKQLIYESELKKQQDLELERGKEKAVIQQEISDLEKDYADTKLTDPDIWGNASTGGKIFLALGALLSSASNQGAQAFRTGIQNLVDRDIDLQKSNLAKKKDTIAGKKGAYSQLLDKYKNDDLANNRFNKLVVDKVDAELEAKIANAKSPLVQAASKKAKSEVVAMKDKLDADYEQKRMEILGKQGEENKKTVEKRTEAQQRYNNIISNVEALEDKLKDTGTWEAFGPEDFQKEKIIYDIALDYAKIVDPASVAREGEVASAQKYLLPVQGFFRSNKTARGVIKDFKESLDRRAQSMGVENVTGNVSSARGDIGARKK